MSYNPQPHQQQQQRPQQTHIQQPHQPPSTSRPSSASSSSSSNNPFISSDQAAAIQSTLKQIEAQFQASVKQIDESLHTPYSVSSARSDYHSLLALLTQLEHQTQPISSIGYDSAILQQFITAPPSNPNEAITRFTQELTSMNQTLKNDQPLLQSTFFQQMNQSRLASKDFKAGMDRMKSGTIPSSLSDPSTVGSVSQPISQQAMHAAQMQFQQQQQQLAQRMR